MEKNDGIRKFSDTNKVSPIDTGNGADTTRTSPPDTGNDADTKQPSHPDTGNGSKLPSTPPFPTQGTEGTPDTSYSEQGEHVNFSEPSQQ